MSVTYARFDELEWTVPALPPGLTPEQVDRGMKVRRKGLSAGTDGFFASHVSMPPGTVTDPHSHTHAELMVVLAGSMDFDGGDGPVTVRANDALTVSAGTVYGFVVGDEGVTFLLVRTDKAVSTMATAGAGAAGGA